MEFKKGEKVTFIGRLDEIPQKGIVKGESGQPGFVWVVYNCDGDWENYINYTSAITDKKHLFKGWWSREDAPVEKVGLPEPLPEVDYQPVYDLAVSLVEKRGGPDYCDDCDDDHWCFETVMEAVYGKGIWNWWNKSRG